MGALIVARYPRHPIGWLLSAVGTAGAVSLVAEAYAYWVQEGDGPGSASLGGVGGLGLVAARRPARDRRDRADVPARAGRPAAVAPVAVRRVGDRRSAPLLCLVAVLSIPPADFRSTADGETELGPAAWPC